MHQDFDLRVAESFITSFKQSQKTYEKGSVVTLLDAGTCACVFSLIIYSSTSSTSPETIGNHWVALTHIVLADLIS